MQQQQRGHTYMSEMLNWFHLFLRPQAVASVGSAPNSCCNVLVKGAAARCCCRVQLLEWRVRSGAGLLVPLQGAATRCCS